MELNEVARRVFDAIEPALEKAGFTVLDGDAYSVIVRFSDSGMDVEIKVAEIAE